MKLGRSSNPIFSTNRFGNSSVFTAEKDGVMTLNGTLNKMLILFSALLITAYFAWQAVFAAPQYAYPLIIGGAIGGLIVAFVTVFRPQYSHISAPIYAIFEGLFVGAISAMYSMFYEGIVLQAVGLTLAILFVMLMAYRSGWIRATPKFKRGVIIATMGVFFFYMLNFIFGLFGNSLDFFALGGMGILISLVIVVIAAMNLILDFDNIEKGIQNGMPKYTEWYVSFGIMVTLIWLYLELLRLLALLSGRD